MGIASNWCCISTLFFMSKNHGMRCRLYDIKTFHTNQLKKIKFSNEKKKLMIIFPHILCCGLFSTFLVKKFLLLLMLFQKTPGRFRTSLIFYKFSFRDEKNYIFNFFWIFFFSVLFHFSFYFCHFLFWKEASLCGFLNEVEMNLIFLLWWVCVS